MLPSEVEVILRFDPFFSYRRLLKQRPYFYSDPYYFYYLPVGKVFSIEEVGIFAVPFWLFIRGVRWAESDNLQPLHWILNAAEVQNSSVQVKDELLYLLRAGRVQCLWVNDATSTCLLQKSSPHVGYCKCAWDAVFWSNTYHFVLIFLVEILTDYTGFVNRKSLWLPSALFLKPMSTHAPVWWLCGSDCW